MYKFDILKKIFNETNRTTSNMLTYVFISAEKYGQGNYVNNVRCKTEEYACV